MARRTTMLKSDAAMLLLVQKDKAGELIGALRSAVDMLSEMGGVGSEDQFECCQTVIAAANAAIATAEAAGIKEA